MVDTAIKTVIGKGLLIYDGDCGFCERSAGWLRKRLPQGYEVQPSSKLDLAELGLDKKQVHEAAYWIDPDGTKHRGHRAIIRAMERSGGVLGAVGRSAKLRIFDPVTSWVYDLVARNRHRLPGARDHCHI